MRVTFDTNALSDVIASETSQRGALGTASGKKVRAAIETLAIWPAPQAGSRHLIEASELLSMTCSISARVAQGGVGKSSGLSFTCQRPSTAVSINSCAPCASASPSWSTSLRRQPSPVKPR